jgi:hypothetical protein
MHREDAATRSFSWVEVRADAVVFRYAPTSPCLAVPPLFEIALTREPAPSGPPGTAKGCAASET